MNISQQIEAILFFKGEPVKRDRLISVLKIDNETLTKGLESLDEALKDRGISLIQNNDEISLGTSKEMSSLIEDLTREEINKDIGKAGLETLSIILYLGPIPRAEIEYIRGVNCQFILRNLLIRGLIEREESKTDARVYNYKTSISLLNHLGLKNISELPDLDKVKKQIQDIRNMNDDKKNN
jgi:segregation and condensation protein B